MPHPLVEARRSRLLEMLDRDVQAVGSGSIPLPAERIEFLRREGEELYWNELAWEELTDEERIPGGHLTELVFPGFLAFIDGLLVETVPSGVYEPPRPHPDVVEEILYFLGGRLAETRARLERGADSERLVWARAMTAHLIDLVLYRLYRVSPAEKEFLEARG
jgi:hypothetical protein